MSTHYDARQLQVEDLDPNDDSDSPPPAAGPQFSRRSSTRYGSPIDGGDFPDSDGGGGNLRPQLSRRNSTTVPSQSEPHRRGRVVTFRDSFEDDDSNDGMNPDSVRMMSAREAVAAQEASEAAAAEAAGQPMMMSLMDLLEETDRELGLEGSRYILSDDEDFDDDDDDEEEEEEKGGGAYGDDGEGSMEHTCCVCLVKHKSAAFTPCGHTFCRMCSRELMVVVNA